MVTVLKMIIIKGTVAVIRMMTIKGMVTILGMVAVLVTGLVLRMLNTLVMVRAAIWTPRLNEVYLMFISKIWDRQTDKQPDRQYYIELLCN